MWYGSCCHPVFFVAAGFSFCYCVIVFFFPFFDLRLPQVVFFRVIVAELADLRQPQVVPKFSIFFPLAAAASRAICPLATVPLTEQFCHKWDFGRLAAAASGKKQGNYILMEFGRDPVARAARPGTLMSW